MTNRKFETGALRDTDVGKLDYEAFFSPIAMKAYAEYLNKHRTMPDGSLRDGDNWQKGMPLETYMKSGVRHMMDWWLFHRGFESRGDIADALCGVIFNAQGYLFELLMGTELQDNVTTERMTGDDEADIPSLYDGESASKNLWWRGSSGFHDMGGGAGPDSGYDMGVDDEAVAGGRKGSSDSEWSPIWEQAAEIASASGGGGPGSGLYRMSGGGAGSGPRVVVCGGDAPPCGASPGAAIGPFGAGGRPSPGSSQFDQAAQAAVEGARPPSDLGGRARWGSIAQGVICGWITHPLDDELHVILRQDGGGLKAVPAAEVERLAH